MAIRGRPTKEPGDTDIAEVQARAVRIIGERGPDALLAELQEVAELRGMAMKDRSYVAAEKLLGVERKLRNEIRDIRAIEADQAARDEAVMETELVQALTSMPLSQLEAALARLPAGALERALSRRSMH